MVVTLLALVVFLGLAVAFGYPLVNATTHLADRLPSYVASAETGKGWIGKLVRKYHVQKWVTQNAPKLVTFGQDLSKPALSFGKGAVSLLIELTTIFVLVLLLLLEGPKLRRGTLGLLSRRSADEVSRVASEVNRAVVGYMFGNFLTSIICGVVVFVTLMTTGVPFPGLWALWVALVDFLPMIGGALAGIPTIAFAFASTPSLTAGIVTLIVFVVYTQFENHVLNPIVMSKTVHISPVLVLISVLVSASLGSLVGGLFGGFVAAMLAIPAAGAFQVIVREAWRLSGPPGADGSAANDSALDGSAADGSAVHDSAADSATGETEAADASVTDAPAAGVVVADGVGPVGAAGPGGRLAPGVHPEVAMTEEEKKAAGTLGEEQFQP